MYHPDKFPKDPQFPAIKVWFDTDSELSSQLEEERRVICDSILDSELRRELIREQELLAQAVLRLLRGES